MTETDLSQISEEDRHHPAYPVFLVKMANRSYGHVAWEFFRDGWGAAPVRASAEVEHLRLCCWEFLNVIEMISHGDELAITSARDSLALWRRIIGGDSKKMAGDERSGPDAISQSFEKIGGDLQIVSRMLLTVLEGIMDGDPWALQAAGRDLPLFRKIIDNVQGDSKNG